MRLAIGVLAVLAALAGPARAAGDWQTVSPATGTLRVTVPTAWFTSNWGDSIKVYATNGERDASGRRYSFEERITSISAGAEAKPDQPLAVQLEEAIAHFRTYDRFKLERTRRDRLGGMPALRYVLGYTLPPKHAGGGRAKLLGWLAWHDGKRYSLQCVTTPGSYAALVPFFETVARSFKPIQ